MLIVWLRFVDKTKIGRYSNTVIWRLILGASMNRITGVENYVSGLVLALLCC